MKNERLYTLAELVSFGNYLLSETEKRKEYITHQPENIGQVNDCDIDHWLEERKKGAAQNEAKIEAFPIKAGDKVRIKENLPDELARLRFAAPHGMDSWIGKTTPVLDVYDDRGEVYITVDICAEVPIAACSKIE